MLAILKICFELFRIQHWTLSVAQQHCWLCSNGIENNSEIYFESKMGIGFGLQWPRVENFIERRFQLSMHAFNSQLFWRSIYITQAIIIITIIIQAKPQIQRNMCALSVSSDMRGLKHTIRRSIDEFHFNQNDISPFHTNNHKTRWTITWNGWNMAWKKHSFVSIYLSIFVWRKIENRIHSARTRASNTTQFSQTIQIRIKRDLREQENEPCDNRQCP